MPDPRSVFASLSNQLHRAFRTIAGEIRWQPPHWVTSTAATAAHGWSQLRRRIEADPRQAAAVGAVALLALGGGYATWRWYANRPQPLTVGFVVRAPDLTCYACDPPTPPASLIVSFNDSAAPLARVGHALEGAHPGVTLQPELAGQWSWSDDRTLVFKPKSDWPIDQSYRVTFARHGFSAEQILLRDYQFEFRTKPFAARISGTEFYQDPIVARDKKAVVTLTFTHPVDAASVEKNIKLKMFDRVADKIEKELTAPQFTVVFDKLKLNAYIHSGQIDIPAKGGRLQIIVDRGLRAARGGNEIKLAMQTEVNVPGLNSLSVSGLSLDIARDERNDPQQILLVNMSASVKEADLPGKLNAWLLPEKHPDGKMQAEFERYNPNQPYRWSDVTVKPDILRIATRLELKQVPGEREHSTLQSFRYDAPPKRQVYVTVQRGLQSFGGYVLGDNIERILQVPEFPRELGLLHSGSLLAMSGEKTVTLMTRNIPAVRVEIGRLLPRQLQHLVTQTNGSFSQPRFGSWTFDADNLVERFTKTIAVPSAAPGVAQYEAINLGEYLAKDSADRRGIFFLRVRGWDTEHDQALGGYDSQRWNDNYNAHLGDARLIAITDLGLVVKRSIDGSQDVFVQSLHTGKPVAGANISIMGANGLPILSEVSDSEGHVRFPDLKRFVREQRPVLYLAQLAGDTSFLPLDGRSHSLELSRFDVGGVDDRADRAALTAFLFSDRGLYRPGEQIRLGAIVRTQDWRQGLSGVPLRLDVTDPRGIVVRREVFTPGAAGLNEILHETKLSSPSGTYTFSLSIARNTFGGDLIGSTTVQVREFLPDRLRMHAGFSVTALDGWVSPEDLQAQIDLQNLFGTPAEKRRVSAQMNLSPAFPSFKSFPDYKFYDPEFARESFNERLADAATDANGKVTFKLNLQRFKRATYRLQIMAEGFEADGGRGVSADATQLVSNLSYLVGYKSDGPLGYLSRGSAHSVDFIAIDPHAQRTAVDKLTLTRLELRYVSVLMRQDNGTYKYESRRKEVELRSDPLSIAATGNQIALDTEVPGTFAYLVRDAEGQQLARVEYQVAGDANVTRKMDKNAELEIKLSKRDFAPGEELELSIRAPYTGAGLITIERDRVYAWHWFKTSTTSTVQRIHLPEKLEGNAYVVVTFVRDPGSDEIYASPLSYGAQPFSIDLASRRNAIKVETPSKVKPGETVTLRYQAERPTRIVLFAVDEGILQVARYEIPNPLGYFFQKRSLGVGTTQILDLLLPEFRKLGVTSAPGGDGEELLSQHLNPFRRKGEKPMVYWSGVLDADRTLREVSFVAPDYFNGSVRVMAVAVSDDRIGVFEQSMLVRGDFVLSPNAPVVASPGDEFDVSVGVANQVADSGREADIEVALTPDSGLEVIGSTSLRVAIDEGHEDSVRFRLRAKDQLGAQGLNFSARTKSGAGGSATRRIDLSVRPVVPYMTQLQAGVVRNASVDVPIQRDLYPEYRKLETGISILPMSFAHGFVSYLGHYPYACTEQIVSQALPAIVLGSRPEFGYVRTQPGADLVGLLSELRARQNDEGAYKLWPGGNYVVEFASLYAQLALLEATDRGQPIPGDIVLQGNRYLHKLAARDGNNLSDERNSAMAIYLLTRQAQNPAAELSALRKRLDERYPKEWKQDLAAMWLAAGYSLLKKDAEASQLMRGVRFTESKAPRSMRDSYFDPMTNDALLLWITAKHFSERLQTLEPEVLTTLAQRTTDGWYNSLSAGVTLLALDAYASAGATKARLSIAELLRPDKRARALSLPDTLLPKANFSADAQGLRMTSDSQLNAFYLVETSGFERTGPTKAIREGLEVLREYTDGNGEPLKQLAMGQEILAHLKFRSLRKERLDNIALVDLLPGGFELVMPALPAQQTFASASPNDEHDNDSARVAPPPVCAVCTGGSYSYLQFADAREDRVVFYATADGNVQEIIYRLKATNVGKFSVPPAYGEGMYDRSVHGRSAAGTLEVTRP